LKKVPETDTWFFSASLGAHIHKEKQKIHVLMSTYLVTQTTEEAHISG